MNEAMQLAKAKVRIHRLIRQGRLAEVCEDAGLSQEDVAAALGVTQSAVSRWETGDTAPARGGPPSSSSSWTVTK